VAGAGVDARRAWHGAEHGQMFDKKQHHENSSLREVIVEHQFIAATLRLLWQNGITDAEILRSEFDGYGYDLVLSKGSIVRHIQIKSGLALKRVSIASSLGKRPSGCVVFIQIDDDLNMGPYYWFGGKPNEGLGGLDELGATKRATHNSQGVRPTRSNHRDLPKTKFSKVHSLEELLGLLLGEEFKA
jgi:hypothetical protein